jgi:hypothetical protein
MTVTHISFDPKISLGNVLSILTVVGAVVTAYVRLDARVTALDMIAAERGPVIQQIRDATTALGVRVNEVERKADGIQAIGRELSEIKGELKGIAEQLRRRDREGRANVPTVPQ